MLRVVLKSLIALSVFSIVSVAVILMMAYHHYSQDLPDHHALAEYRPKESTRVFTADGYLMYEAGEEKRIFVPISHIPQHVKDAFIAIEDIRFYEHAGLDAIGILRALKSNLIDKKPLQGASTITQQLVKNSLLTPEKTIERKVKEAILAYRVDRTFSKDTILEIYLNQIYFGAGAYGIATAAQTYFGKTVSDLSIEEAALLAGLPKAPSRLNPFQNYDDALLRRNLVLNRMLFGNFLDERTVRKLQDIPINLVNKKKDKRLHYRPHPYVHGLIDDELKQRLNPKRLERAGLFVHTSLDTDVQVIAQQALQDGLIKHSLKYGYNRAFSKVPDVNQWLNGLETIKSPSSITRFKTAVVLDINSNKRFIEIGLVGGSKGRIPFTSLESIGTKLKNKIPPEKLFYIGDVILVDAIKDGVFKLVHVPDINGAVVVLDNKTGAILALSGGFDYSLSQFNRATHAYRQPGSVFKPFVYLAALEKNHSPADRIADEPLEFGSGNLSIPSWAPENHSGYFYGIKSLRTGLEESLNVMTVRLANMVGISDIASLSQTFGIYDDPPRFDLSMSLGTIETNLLRLTSAYATIANGGKHVTAHAIHSVSDRTGNIIYVPNHITYCSNCTDGRLFDSTQPPSIQFNETPLVSPASAFQLTHMLQGVMEHGTGKPSQVLRMPLAGKTGTTNHAHDAWFIGYTPDVTVGVYVGYDDPQPIGIKEYGSTVALPIFIDVIQQLKPRLGVKPFTAPNDIEMVMIDAKTGFLVGEDTSENYMMLEAFKTGQAPRKSVSHDAELPVINTKGSQDIQTKPSIY